jgi:hypothetical protein
MMLDVKIDHVHSGAVCREIGEVLSAKLGSRSDELPARLIDLIQQLTKAEPPQWREEIL